MKQEIICKKDYEKPIKFGKQKIIWKKPDKKTFGKNWKELKIKGLKNTFWIKNINQYKWNIDNQYKWIRIDEDYIKKQKLYRLFYGIGYKKRSIYMGVVVFKQKNQAVKYAEELMKQ
jgi:hypothetical protein